MVLLREAVATDDPIKKEAIYDKIVKQELRRVQKKMQQARLTLKAEEPEE